MKLLSIETLIEIKDLIQTELKKRCIPAKIALFKEVEKNGKNYIELATNEFNTTPVIFESIKIRGRSLLKKDKDTGIIDIRIQLDFSVEYFSKGTNGVGAFVFSCKVRDYQHVTNIAIT